jgi:dolichol-phosphate mannosyltransferase
VLLALPAHNEEQALPGLLESFRAEMNAAGYAGVVVVVDDGSTDGTRRVAQELARMLPLDLVVDPSNRGLGETIRDGLRRAAELAQPGDLIVTMDADNTHTASLIPDMVRLIQAGNDLVIASRYRPGAGVTGLSAFRRWMSLGARLVFMLGSPISGVRDYTSAFRAYRPSLLQQALARYGDGLVTEPGFASMAEILLRISKMNPRIVEVPSCSGTRRRAAQAR